jgi:hypothetical protein
MYIHRKFNGEFVRKFVQAASCFNFLSDKLPSEEDANLRYNSKASLIICLHLGYDIFNGFWLTIESCSFVMRGS